MGRAVLWDCLPWLALLLVSGAGLWLVVRLNEGGLRLRRLLFLHRNEVGSAQTLSFVLTLPIFVVVLLFIVQVSQLMIGTIMVHYAAFAAARAAIVWIPAAGPGARANSAGGENCENCVEQYTVDAEAPENVFLPIPPVEPSQGGLTYLVSRGGAKYVKIRSAALLACLPICPSRDLGLSLPPDAAAVQSLLKSVYQTLARTSPADARWRNKLAYATQYTDVDIRFYHANSGGLEPPLVHWGINYGDQRRPGPGFDEYREWQEIGWQDPITVTVTHYLALLPGPGRILANRVGFIRTAPDRVQNQIEQDTQEAQAPNVYVYKLTASCTLGNEGEKSVLAYEYQLQ
jgi:hypothetical protein